MKDTNLKQKAKKKLSITENKLKANKINKKELIKKELKNTQIYSNFKLELLKDKEPEDYIKSTKEVNSKKIISFNIDKKNRKSSVTQDLISKILEINNKKSSFINNTPSFFLNQKEETFQNEFNSNKTNRININNFPIENKDESKISFKKNGNNRIQESNLFTKNKNSKQDKNNINNIRAVITQDFRKRRNIKLDSSNSHTDHQSDNEHKYNSSIIDNFRGHLKNTDILFGLHQISGSSSNKQLTFRLTSQNNLVNNQANQVSNLKNNNNNNIIRYTMSKKQKEIADSISELDLVKLKKEVYEYENTDVTDAINKLPTHEFFSDKNKNNKKKIKHNIKHLKRKNKKGKLIKKYIENIKERFRILRRVRYVYDSLDDEECEDVEDNNFYFEPNSKFILILDFLIFASSLFYLVFLPIHLSRSPFNEIYGFEDFVYFFIDIIFIIDFISSFFRAYFNFDEDLIKNSVLIIKNYMKTWFLSDFLCSIPVYSILKSSLNRFENKKFNENEYFNNNVKNLYYLLEMVKLLKLIKAFKANVAKKKIANKIKKISFIYYWGHFIKQVFIFISIINISSCLFIFSARISYPNWILNLNMNMQNFISIYICSFYYIITTITTVGYGDIQITSMTERVFELFFLIVGTCLYSWMLTSASNYIIKMNEKNIKFDQKIKILDNIKANYPLMSNDLYRRVYKLLYYKKCYEEVDKNIIIDILPYSIRNNLLIQMYFPIIANFKFFRYFKNSEFIIEIVSVLKPLVGIKGDLLINEGDYVEDIIFNKSGILSLEICIDLNNSDEFIKQYLTKYNLENIKSKKNLDTNIGISSTNRKNSINSSFFSKSSVNINKVNNSISSTIKPNSNMSFLMSIRDQKSTLDKRKVNKNNFHFLKILNIREKEHFGDVLMFLNEPSPLNVRVNSKNAEILLLNKTDVVKISSNFPNIWKRINEKSIFNLEQIKNLIMRKLSIFCYSNGIKIKSLFYRKDTMTGQNKVNYSLIPIPDSTQAKKLNQNNNLIENDDQNSKSSENNTSKVFENSSEENSYIIKEVQSSEESGTNTKLSKGFKYSHENNTMSKKKTSKKMSDSINISIQKELVSDKSIYNKKYNKYYDQNIEIKSQLLAHSKSFCNFYDKKISAFSNKHLKNSVKNNRFKININTDNITNSHENFSSKISKKSYVSNSPITNNIFNISTITFPKGPKYQNFAEKSKINRKLISIPSFNFMQSYNNISINCESENINDEIYSNENFEIKIPNNDQNLIIHNKIESQENSNSKCPESPKKLLISHKNSFSIISFIKEDKLIDISNNLNNKFNNLKISSISTLEIKSSYDNINEFTKYKFISNDLLIKKTKMFLSKECGNLYDVNKKYVNMPYHTPTHNRKIKSKSTLKVTKFLHNKKCNDNINNINNLSVINDFDDNDIISPQPFSRQLKKLGYKKSKKDNENFLKNSLIDVRDLNKSFVHFSRNASIKEENEIPRKGNETCKNCFSNFSPKKTRRQSGLFSEISLKTKTKLDLISKNMERDSRNLNNPNEFYADLFSNFYKKKIKKNESMHKITVMQNNKWNCDSGENKEEDKVNNLNDN